MEYVVICIHTYTNIVLVSFRYIVHTRIVNALNNKGDIYVVYRKNIACLV